MIERLEFELAYYSIAVEYFSHKATETRSQILLDVCEACVTS